MILTGCRNAKDLMPYGTGSFFVLAGDRNKHIPVICPEV